MELTKLAAGPEFDLIRSFASQASLTHPLVRVGPGDDCAVVGDLAISTDASVENVHFRRDWLSAEEIGWRAVAAALSDLAAMAAAPVGVLTSLVLTQKDHGSFAQDIMQGAIAAAESVGASLLGGDTTAGAALMLDVVVVGRVEQPVLRAGARPGDEVWVTGRLGGAAAAVAAFERGVLPASAARARYAHILPRVEAARWLQQHVQPTAMIDISDGLYGDAAHLAAASECRVTLEAARIPIDHQAGATFESATTGGEDYELCFTASAGAVEPLRERFQRQFDLPLTCVGAVSSGAGVWERAADGNVRAIEQAAGYQHFKDDGH